MWGKRLLWRWGGGLSFKGGGRGGKVDEKRKN